MTEELDKLTEEIKQTVVESLKKMEQEHMAEIMPLKVPSRDEFTGDVGSRIGKLTNEAVMQSAEQAAKDVMMSVAQAEAIVKMLREEAELLSQDIKHNAELYAARISKAIDAMRDITLAMRERRDGLSAQFNLESKRAG